MKMDKNKILFIALVSVLVAVVTVVVLKILGHSNPTVAGGAITGGVIGAISSVFLRKGKE